MFSRPSHFRRRLLAATPKQLLHPPLHHLSTTAAAAANRAPTTHVTVLWDFAAVRLHLAATFFGRLPAVFIHPSHRLPAPAPSAHLCRVCGRRFRDRDALLRHFDAIHTHEHAKHLERINSSRGNRRTRLASPRPSPSSSPSTPRPPASSPPSRTLAPPPTTSAAPASVRELIWTLSASLRDRTHEVLDEGSAWWKPESGSRATRVGG